MATAFYKQLGRNLKALRLSCGASQNDVARILDVTYQQVQKYESGTTRLPLDKLSILKEFYGVPYEAFLSDTGL